MTEHLPDDLLRQLGYQPVDSSLLLRALTHRSFSSDNNERLEFLGDAILDLAIAEALYHRFTDKSEGELSRYRAELVRSPSLAAIALQIGLDKVLRLGEGERKSGGAGRESILSGTLEALIGAIYLDRGIVEANRVIAVLFQSSLDAIEKVASQKDPKTALQEWLQARGKPLPHYALISITGQHHNQVFRIACRVDTYAKTVEAEGSSKKLAERQAAALMLDWINQEKKP